MGRRSVVAALIVWHVSAATSLTAAQYDCSGAPEVSNTELFKYEVVNGLTQALFLAVPPGDRQRLFIVERAGRIKIHKHGTSRATVSTFLDITARVNSSAQEMGLLGLAFDPDYQTTGYFWVNYTEIVAGQIYTVIARYRSHAAAPTSLSPRARHEFCGSRSRRTITTVEC